VRLTTPLLSDLIHCLLLNRDRHEEVNRFETAKKQDQEASQKAQKLANKVLDIVSIPSIEAITGLAHFEQVQKAGKHGKEHDFYVPGTSKRANQQILCTYLVSDPMLILELTHLLN